MASSFLSQIPSIVYLVSQLNPTTILDIGKGFGKYGFLVHEYVGIDNTKKINPLLMLKEQSRLNIDAVEVDEDLILPHLNHIYREIIIGDILLLYDKLPGYDLLLMIDIIEHLDKFSALQMLKTLLSKNDCIIIATPKVFFDQHLYESKYEEHISHWSLKDFKDLAFVDFQVFDGGGVYLLSLHKLNIWGFGNSFIKRIRRLFRSVKNELNV